MTAAAGVGVLYAGIAFALGAVLGPARELLLAPRFGGMAAAIVEAAETNSPAEPDNDRHHGAAADLCAICAVTAMAGSALDAASPTLPQQQAHAIHYRLAASGIAEPSAPPCAFQPRAPPLS